MGRLLPHLRVYGRPHGGAFLLGCLAALSVVASRLLLPWPLHALMDHWKAAEGAVAASSGGILDGPVWYGVLFLGALVLLGVGDAIERLYFAKFAIGMTRDLRAAALGAALEARDGAETASGDLVARLVGDTARLKAGLKGFLVHVATNGLLFLGVTVVLLTVNVKLGLVFGAAGVGTAIVTVLGGRALLRLSTKYRRKEGKLANQIDRAMRKGRWKENFVATNRSSGRHEAALTRVQSLTTAATYVIFGLAVLAAVSFGSNDIDAGRLEPRGLLVFLIYALIIRGPMVRLARQGSRLGKIMAVANRVVEVLESRPRPENSNQTATTFIEDGRPGEPSELSIMTEHSKTRVLFTGYAPVHFLCFRPLFERLRGLDEVEVHVSGGLKTVTEEGTTYDHEAMYGPLGVPAENVLSVSEIAERDFDYLFAGTTSLILPRSVRKKVQIFHGLSFRNRGIRAANMNCDYYFIVGPYMQRRFIETELMDLGDPRAIPIGFMKTDRLLNGELDRGELLKRYQLDGSRPVVLFAPTGQKHNAMETVGEQVIEQIVASDRFDLICKLHDHPKNEIDWATRLKRFEGPHFRLLDEPDVILPLFVADVLLSDASSVTNEYALLDRPTVFVDVPKLLAKAAQKTDAAMDLDTWGRKGGPIVGDPKDLVGVIDDCLGGAVQGSAYSEVRRAAAADLFYNPGSATDAAVTWFQDQIGVARRASIA